MIPKIDSSCKLRNRLSGVANMHINTSAEDLITVY